MLERLVNRAGDTLQKAIDEDKQAAEDLAEKISNLVDAFDAFAETTETPDED